jgi:hypothetical protein
MVVVSIRIEVVEGNNLNCSEIEVMFDIELSLGIFFEPIMLMRDKRVQHIC